MEGKHAKFLGLVVCAVVLGTLALVLQLEIYPRTCVSETQAHDAVAANLILAQWNNTARQWTLSFSGDINTTCPCPLVRIESLIPWNVESDPAYVHTNGCRFVTDVSYHCNKLIPVFSAFSALVSIVSALLIFRNVCICCCNRRFEIVEV